MNTLVKVTIFIILFSLMNVVFADSTSTLSDTLATSSDSSQSNLSDTLGTAPLDIQQIERLKTTGEYRPPQNRRTSSDSDHSKLEECHV